MMNYINFEPIVYYLGLFCLINIFVVIVVRISVYLWGKYTRGGVVWCGGPDAWAVITGSTDGIGLEFARQLAQKGYNLLLLSRSIDKLIRVRDELKERHKCQIRLLAVDFSRTDIYDRIDEELKELGEIHVLVNNVGISYPNEISGYFTQIPNLKEFIFDIINVNIMAATRLTALVLPRMKNRGRGVIINLSSFVAVCPAPLFSIYSASKVYIDFLSRAMSEEYKSEGIVIKSLTPSTIKTKMTRNIYDTQPFNITAEEYVEKALKTVGENDSSGGHSQFNLAISLFKSIQVISIIFNIDLAIKIFHYAANVSRIDYKSKNK